MHDIICRYCNGIISDGSKMALVKEPHRAPLAAHDSCGRAAVAEGRGRVTMTEKQNVRGLISDPVDFSKTQT